MPLRSLPYALKTLAVALSLLGAIASAATLGGCSDDDYGADRPAQDANASVTTDLTTAPLDLSVVQPRDATIEDGGDGGDAGGG